LFVKLKEANVQAEHDSQISNEQNALEIVKEIQVKVEKAEKLKKIADVVQSETVKVKSKIKSIMQTSDKANSENILDKLNKYSQDGWPSIFHQNGWIVVPSFPQIPVQISVLDGF